MKGGLFLFFCFLRRSGSCWPVPSQRWKIGWRQSMPRSRRCLCGSTTCRKMTIVDRGEFYPSPTYLTSLSMLLVLIPIYKKETFFSHLMLGVFDKLWMIREVAICRESKGK